MPRPTSTPVLASLVLLAALAAGGCEGRGTRPPPGGELLRPGFYTIPQAHLEEAWRVTSGALKDGPPGARVERLPDGRLLVVATAELHEDIAGLLRKFGDAQPILSAELDYWLVLGEPTPAPIGLDVVPEIAPVLRDIVASQGSMKFTLLETSRLSSMLDESASAQGDLAQVNQVVSVVAGVPVADITIELRGEYGNKIHQRSLHSRVNFRPGQLLILGESGYNDDGRPGEPPVRKTVFYILRAAVTRDG